MISDNTKNNNNQTTSSSTSSTSYKHEEEVTSFDDLNLKPDLVRGIYGYGFTRPSSIQALGISPMISKKDTIAQAQSGTGKTGTFSISCLQLIDEKTPKTQALILAPVRELALQIKNVVQNLGEYLDVSVEVFTGGTNVVNDKKILQQGVHVAVGTPGRILSLIKSGVLKTDYIQTFILDEADEMLGRGFQDQMKSIFSLMPGDVQIGLFSATMSPDMLDLTKQFMRNPATILVKNDELTLDGIKQFYVAISKEDWKFATLVDIYNNISIQQCMIYCNEKKRVDELTAKLREKNFTVSCMHSNMEHAERELVMKEFRTGSSRVLITTDLLARGIDVQSVSLVINYDLPISKEKYIHRIGRSGRYGKKGVAINFVTPVDAKFMKQVEQFYNTEIVELPYDLDKLNQDQ